LEVRDADGKSGDKWVFRDFDTPLKKGIKCVPDPNQWASDTIFDFPLVCCWVFSEIATSISVKAVKSGE
jgi:hypothetical protein